MNTEKIMDDVKTIACEVGEELLRNDEFKAWAGDTVRNAGETVLSVVGETAVGGAILAAGTAAAPLVVPAAAVAAAGVAVGYGIHSLVKWLAEKEDTE